MVVKKITIYKSLIKWLPATKLLYGNIYCLNVDDMLGSEPPVAMNHNLSVARQGELCACLLIGCSIADVLVVAYPHMGSTHGITKCYPHPSNKSLVEVVDNGVAL